MSQTRVVHLHLVSDATGETLVNVARAAAAQYHETQPIEHVHSLVRSLSHVERVAAAIADAPGIVLYTLIEAELASALEAECAALGVPAVSVLDPVLSAFQSYIGTRSTGRIGAQHVLDADYFRRIDALNFSLAHDDGQLPDNIEHADIILVGISRTSKTPTSIYLANRGYMTANVPLVPGVPPPPALTRAKRPLIVGLVANADRIVQIRQHRLLGLKADDRHDTYTDRAAVAAEITESRRLFTSLGWPVIDVSRRAIEETAAAILGLLAKREQT